MAVSNANDPEAPAIKGDIVKEDDLYKVIFNHEGQDYTLGFFGSIDESNRVCDVLNIKEAVDERRDLEKLRLHFDLARYGVDNDTAGEIRSVSFRQVVRDLQVCAVQPIKGALPDETQATSWGLVGGPAITGGTVYHDPQEHSIHPAISTGNAAATVPRGGVALPPQGAASRRAASRSTAALRSTGAAPSAARAAFNAAGLANAAAAADTSPQPRPPVPPPPKFSEPAAQPQQQQAEQQKQQQQHEMRQEGLPPANGNVPAVGRSHSRASDHTPRSARKRPHVGDEEAEEQEGEAESGEVSARTESAEARQKAAATQKQARGAGGAAAAAAAAPAPAPEAAGPAQHGGAAAGDADMRDAEAGEEGAAAQARAGARPSGEAAGQAEDAGAAAAAAVPATGTGKKRAGGLPKGGRGGKRRRSSAAYGGVPGERPWQEQDVMAFTPDNHPFRGITRDSAHGTSMAAQLPVRMSGSNLSPGGKETKNVRFARCGSAAEAAASWDLGAMWRAMQYGQDPAGLDKGVDGGPWLNFDYSRYAALLPTLRAAKTANELQAQVKALRDNGTLARIAGGSADAAAAAAAAAGGKGFATKGAEGKAADKAGARAAPSATAAAAPSPVARPAASFPNAPGVRSSSGYKGVHGSGPWAAQITLKADKLLPEQQSEWTSRRGEHMLRIAGCTSPELAAACFDLFTLWRCQLYGEDPASVALNFPLASYATFQPGLRSHSMDSVAGHISGLRDRGALTPVLASSRRVSPPSAKPVAPLAARKPAAAPPLPPASPQKQAQQAQQAQAHREAGKGPKHQQVQPVEAEPLPSPPEEAPRGPAPQRPAAAAAAAAAGAGAGAASPRGAAAGAAGWSEQGGGSGGALVVRGGSGAAAAVTMQQQQQHQAQLRGMNREDVQQAAYRREEMTQVQVQQALYLEMEAWLSTVHQLSEVEVVSYMGHFIQHRDMRTIMYDKIKQWVTAGKHALVVHYVRSVVGSQQG